MAEIDWTEAYKGLLGPTEEDKRQAMTMGLLGAGLGILGSNYGNYGRLGPALAGAAPGIAAYQSTLKGAQQERQQGISMALAMEKLKREKAQQEMLARAYGGDTAVAQAAPSVAQMGDSPMRTAMNPGTPSFNPASGPSLSMLGQLAAAGVDVKPHLQLWELNNPKREVQGGYVFDPRAATPGTFLPQVNMTPEGRATASIPGRPGELPTVAPLPGSLGTYGAFQDVQQQANARYGAPIRRTLPSGEEELISPLQFGLQQNGPFTPQQAPVVPSSTPGRLTAPNEQAAYKLVRAAADAGVPMSIEAPADVARTPAGMLSGKTTEQATREAATKSGMEAEAAKRGGFWGEQFGKVQESGFAAYAKIDRLNRLESLLDGVNTGKLTPLGTEVAAYAQSVGAKVDPKLGNKQAGDALLKEMALQFRNPAGGAGMPGAMSDADREFLAKMTPNLATATEGRKQIIETQRKLATRDQDVARLASEYVKRNGKMDEGFTDELKRFAKENPLFPKAEKSTMEEMPPASQHKGKVIQDDSGKRFRSDGMSWRPM